ncbi:DUF6087 family protein [Streptomyces prunicolor]|uniref:DUF6087 family protein n=1 Tax=Streptomyces prunicolor TaxID=67348 RepID=UPI00343DE76B
MPTTRSLRTTSGADRRWTSSGGAAHLRPDEPRVLEEWDGFTYQVVGTADDLAAAQGWVNGLRIGDDPAV